MRPKPVPGLGAGASGSPISLYVLPGIGVVIMVYARASRSAYFATPREVFPPRAGAGPASQVPADQPTD